MSGRPLLSSADLKNYTSTSGAVPDFDVLLKPYESKTIKYDENKLYEKPKVIPTTPCSMQSNSLPCSPNPAIPREYVEESEVKLLSRFCCNGLWTQPSPANPINNKCTVNGGAGISILGKSKHTM
ncbi:MAG: hypothetical protein LBH98_05135 [Chitinispirillales bacterium]|jgi:hypothetical protein|nr:hypothetical protein [Chitinispirillales bacterium]